MLTILRTVPNRSSEHLKKYVDIIFNDRNLLGSLSFVNQLKFMASLNDDILFLEDDIALSDEQCKFIDEMITKHADILINFSSRRFGISMCKPETFLFTQCVYFPRRIIAKLVSSLNIDIFLRESHYDVAMRKLLDEDYLSINYTKAITDLKLKSVMKYY